MKILTILCNNLFDYENKKINIINIDDKNLYDVIDNINSKYVIYIKNYNDYVEGFIDKVLEKCKSEFDACFINYKIEEDGMIIDDLIYEDYDLKTKPYINKFFWSYIFNADKLRELIDSDDYSTDNVDSIFKNIDCFSDFMYTHKPTERLIEDFIYTDEVRDVERYKNVIYVGDYCNGRFNGYITWINNIGRCFGNDYDIVVMYDKMFEPTRKIFAKHFKTVQKQEDVAYLCDRLLVTYSTYYYPKNIICTDESYLFIHGNMSDYPNTRKYYHDIYTKYIAVSKIAQEKAAGYFPVKDSEIDYINNPIRIDKEQIKYHLKLVSAQRDAEVKRTERIKKIADILNKEEIPYTWNLFTDSATPDKIFGGLVYRSPIANTLPYVNDCDYFVQLSDSEAYSYSVLEAIYLNTKVVVTPLECYDEMKIDKESSIIIPFEFFDDNNKDKLREVVLRMYHNVDKKYNNRLDDSQFERYNELFIK